ncbi:polysaccharide biosynthesis protein [Enterococcus camelliae]|uniref:Polysaccharide biosynthesis protein n=1 Tax=Enterococcus camelliae TaxID=453959 RepID=A0ABW5TIH8_9ENTE
MTRRWKIATLMLVDSILIVFASICAISFLSPYVTINSRWYWMLSLFFITGYLFFGWLFRIFTRINRFTNLHELISIFMATFCTYVVNLIFIYVFFGIFSKRLVTFIFIFSTFLIIASRLTWRYLVEKHNEKHSLNQTQKVKRTLLIGAGEGGRILLNSFSGSKTAGDIKIVGLIDDDINKKNMYLSNVQVLGTTCELPDIIKKYEIDMVTIAMPSISRKELQRIISIIEPYKVKVNTMPSVEEIAIGHVNISKLKKIDVVDLLGREEVELDIASIKEQITNKVILVTGAGGSIGSEICRQVMQFQPKKILLLGHGENSIYLIDRELKNKYPDRKKDIIPIIADIQDRKKIFEVMDKYRPAIVYHAAAHKHVPMMEYNPREAVKNNIFGTKNVAEAAKAYDVEHFVMISTDKANNPPNVMGATKRIAEMIVTGLNEEGKTKFSATRFGNVLGSRGSVIPVFREQIEKGGPVTVTDFRMTRYFMTIPEASRLVIQSGALAKGGEIFVLDMSTPVKIVDLAKNMIRLSGYSEDDIEIIETGIRPGEKLYEELLLDKERNEEKVFDKIFVGNIKGFTLEKVMVFANALLENDDQTLAKEVVNFAKNSSK